MTAGSDLAYKYAMATRAPWLLLVVSAAACTGAPDRPGSARISVSSRTCAERRATASLVSMISTPGKSAAISAARKW